jgi:putative hydrolase of the HAD superfamily
VIVALDLDDTLYPEITYVQSGLRAVADHLQEWLSVDPEESLRVMESSLDLNGRGRAFDDVLDYWGISGQSSIRRLVQVYRHHEPRISLPRESSRVLEMLTSSGHALYLVTDGHKVVQATKISALGLASRFRHCYLTSRYGRVAAKPSPRVFDLMLRRERADVSQLIHVADDPTKDFIGIRRMGGQTIRVRTGRNALIAAAPGFDADATVDRLEAILDLVAYAEANRLCWLR